MLDILKKRRSCREFEDRAVEKEKTEKILAAGQLAPSGKNTRPWEFIVIEDKKTLKELGNCRAPSQPFLPDSPLAIVVLGDTNKTDTWVEDASISAVIMQLEAEQLGLGSCWVQIRMRESNQGVTGAQYLRGLLKIPENMGVLCVLAVGYPKKTLPEHIGNIDRKKIHKEIY